MTFKQLCKMHEVERNAMTIRFTRDYKKRAVELLTELCKHYPIAGVTMGNGIWFFQGFPVPVIDHAYSETEARRVELPLDEFQEWLEDMHDGIQPIGITLRHRRLFRELNDLLEAVCCDYPFVIKRSEIL